MKGQSSHNIAQLLVSGLVGTLVLAFLFFLFIPTVIGVLDKVGKDLGIENPLLNSLKGTYSFIFAIIDLLDNIEFWLVILAIILGAVGYNHFFGEGGRQ